MSILVTGGAGFIGSNFVLDWFTHSDEPIVNLDKLTYAGNLENLADLLDDTRHTYLHGDIGDMALTRRLLCRYKPRAVINFAAEKPSDASVQGPDDFIQTNVLGTHRLLKAVYEYWSELPRSVKDGFRFLHISSDKVYGPLGHTGLDPAQNATYAPYSPYTASKAASDHLVNAYHLHYGLPTLIARCSRNYGPYQFPNELIPTWITHALADEPLVINGSGQHIDNWMYVKDNCRAIQRILEAGQVGHAYNLSGNERKTRTDVVYALCRVLDELLPRPDGLSYQAQIAFQHNNTGSRYQKKAAMKATEDNLLYTPTETLSSGLHKTVQWHLENQPLIRSVRCGAHQDWLNTQYAV